MIRLTIAGILIAAPVFACDWHDPNKHQQTFDGEVEPLVPDPAPRNVRLRGHMGYSQISTDIWGYTDPNGREYACMGLLRGVTIVDITDPDAPIEVAYLEGVESQWRDLKTYGEYLYVVADQGDDGLVVIDLSELPGRARIVHQHRDFQKAHNLHIDSERALAYVVGSERNNGGLRIIDLSNPEAPETIGVYSERYVHDAHGRGNILFTFDGFDAGSIIDVSDPTAPVLTARFTYPGQAYTHSGWTTDDLEYLLVNDEFDESPDTKHGDGDGHDGQVRTRVIVMRRVGNGPGYEYFSEYRGPNRATDHNVFINGEFAYLSNYTMGLTVIDLADMQQPRLYGRYDTYPANDDAGFAGAWGVYPFYESRTVVLSDRSSGMYIFEILSDRDRDGLPDEDDADPDTPDADNDGLPDGWETRHGFDPAIAEGEDGPEGDPDEDNLNNLWEYMLDTDPRRRDTDSDGLTDGEEHERGSDPIDRHSPVPDTGGQSGILGCSSGRGADSLSWIDLLAAFGVSFALATHPRGVGNSARRTGVSARSTAR